MPYVDDLATSSTWMRSAAPAQAGRRSAGRRGSALLGADRTVYGLDIEVVNPHVDPTFSFMTVDHDGKIRMDCSSPYAMAGLVGLKDKYQVAFGQRSRCRPARHRHAFGWADESRIIIWRWRFATCSTHRPSGRRGRGRQDARLQQPDRPGRRQRAGTLCEVPVGFKWFAPGLFDGTCCFGGEESAGASFLRQDGTVWTTDKDGIILGLLAAEITARTGKDPGQHYQELAAQFGQPYYTRIDAPATPEQKARLQKLSPDAVKAAEDGGRADRRQADRGPGQRRGDRRPEGRDRKAAGSRPGLRAPRTSTRSMPRASVSQRIWTTSSARPRRS